MQSIEPSDLVDIIDQSVQHAIRVTRSERKAFDFRDPVDRGPLMKAIARAVARGVFLALLGISVVGGAVAWRLAVHQQVWSYKIEGIHDADWDATMNGLGRVGWDLVTCRRATASDTRGMLYECIFKRPK